MLLRASTRRFVLAVAVVGVGVMSAGPGIAGSAPRPGGPLVAARYSIVVDGVEVASFNHLVAMTRDFNKSPTVEFQGPYTQSMAIENWYQAAKQNPTTGRKDFVLIMSDSAGTAVAKYNFTKGSPSTIVVTGTSAGGSDVLHLDVTFTGEHVQRVSP